MLLEVEYITAETTIVIETDNCSSQYKSAAHFQGRQDLWNKYKSTITHLYSIAVHGKGKVDHVGGIVKTAFRREILGGEVLLYCDLMVSFLKLNLIIMKIHVILLKKLKKVIFKSKSIIQNWKFISE